MEFHEKSDDVDRCVKILMTTLHFLKKKLN